MTITRAYAAVIAERLQTTAQLAAAGVSYRQLASAFHVTPDHAYALAQTGARLLLRTGTAPPELRDALTALPPLHTPPRRLRGPRTLLPEPPSPHWTPPPSTSPPRTSPTSPQLTTP